MAPRYGARIAEETSERLNFAREFRARPNAELGIDRSQMAGDGPLGEEQDSRYFMVGPAFCDERRNAALGCRQAVIRRTTADRPQLVAGFLEPDAGPELLEAGKGATNCFACGALLACSTEDDADCEQGARASELVAGCFMLSDRLAQERDRLIDGAAGRSAEASAAGACGKCRVAADPLGRCFPGVDDSRRLVNPVKLEERLNVVGCPGTRTWRIPPQRLRLVVRLPEECGGRCGVSARKRDKAGHCLEQRRMKADLLFAELQATVRLVEGDLELASMHRDPRDRNVVLVLLDSVLGGDLPGAGGVLGRQAPTPAG